MDHLEGAAQVNQITVSTIGLDEVVARTGALPRQADAALKRALRKTVAWVASQSRREIARDVGVAQSAIKQRIASRLTKSARPVGLIWFGLNRLDASLAGKASQGAAGVKVRKYIFPGAFLASIYGSAAKVWIRLRSRNYDPVVYPYTKRRSFTDVPAGLRSRFPVVKATIAIDTPSVRAIIADKAGMARERMRTLLLQELNYEINVKGGG